MPYKDKNRKVQNNKKLRMKKRNVPSEVPSEVPNDAYIYHSIRRFELYYDMLQMREELKKQTYFNNWMSRQIDVVDEIKFIENANIEYKKNKLVNDTKPNIQFTITPIPFDESKIENYKACCLGKIYLKIENNLNIDNI